MRILSLRPLNLNRHPLEFFLGGGGQIGLHLLHCFARLRRVLMVVLGRKVVLGCFPMTQMSVKQRLYLWSDGGGP
ncbi:MAG TPA: hypothetical protein VKB77_03305 [Terriglobales bacterium]|nr:hypothetical protein [Terriglobales bacterium]